MFQYLMFGLKKLARETIEAFPISLHNYAEVLRENGLFLYSPVQCSGSARIRIKKCLLDPDPHGQMWIRIN